MEKLYFENPDIVFLHAPEIQDVCIEFGIDKSDLRTITYMYEVFKRVIKNQGPVFRCDDYDDGYKDGYNAAIGEAVNLVDDLSYEIERLKKN